MQVAHKSNRPRWNAAVEELDERDVHDFKFAPFFDSSLRPGHGSSPRPIKFADGFFGKLHHSCPKPLRS